MRRRAPAATPELRISGGLRRGMKIESVPGIRPTLSWVRQALFDIWSQRVGGSSFLDLFAGSGAVGIEAASRGAERVVLVERDPGVHAVLSRNLRLVDLPGLTVLRAELPGELGRRLGRYRRRLAEKPGPGQESRDRFDLIFADPPYEFRAHAELLGAAEAELEEGGEIALEHRFRDGEPHAPDSLDLVSRRRYGDSGLAIYCRRT